MCSNVIKKNQHLNRMITNFTIFGERRTGTNYLLKCLQTNLKIPFTGEYGYKHWYIQDIEPRGRKNTTTDTETSRSIHDADHTLFVIIIRNPHDWVSGMKNKPWHMPECDCSSTFNFIRKKYVSYETKKSHDSWSFDPITKKYFIEEADNLIDLRNKKHEHLYALRYHVKNYFIIRQERLLEDIEQLIRQFGLETKYDKVKMEGYKPPTKYPIGKPAIDFIKQNLHNSIDTMFYPEYCVLK